MKRKTFTSILVTALVCAVASMAYFFVAGLGEGSHTAKAGEPSPEHFPIAVAFNEGLVPGAKEPITFTLEPKKATDIKKLTTTITIDKAHAEAGCLASWFTISTENGFWQSVLEGKQATATSVPAGAYNLENMAAKYQLAFEELEATNQNACAGASITVNAVSTP
jgi:hypothetical protein